MHVTRSPRLFLIAASSLLLATAGCGDDTTTPAPGGAPVDPAAGTSAAPGGDAEGAAAMVPQDIRDQGTLTIGTDASYAPGEFLDTDGSTVVGMDVDLFDAVADKLDLETTWQNADFDTIIAGVDAGKYDLGVSSFTINEDRKEQVNMISYFEAGTQWAVAADSTVSVDPDAPCGLTVAVQTGTVQEMEDLPPKIEQCEQAGDPLQVQSYGGQDEATAALVTGKVDAMLADSPVVGYAVTQTDGKIEAVGDVYDSAPYGYVVPLDDPELAEAIKTALDELAADGGYEQALNEWGQTAGGISDFTVNP